MLNVALALTSALSAWMSNHDFSINKSLIADIVTGFLESGKNGAYNALQSHHYSGDISHELWSKLYDALADILDA